MPTIASPTTQGAPGSTSTFAAPTTSALPGAQAPPTAVPPQLADPIVNFLMQDAAFGAAVKRGDVAQAAAAASKLIKQNLQSIIARIKPQQQSAMANLMGGGGSFSGGMRPQDLRHTSMDPAMDAALGPGRQRELHKGDWVLIKSVNKSTDPELQGQEAWVSKVETNGWVEVTVPRLGRVVKMQQRYLQWIPPPSGTPGAAGGGRQRSMSGGVYGPGGMEGRPSKRQAMDNSVRPALSLDKLPPAKVPSSSASRGGPGKLKELVRTVRKEILTLEQNIPWGGVASSWRSSRPSWLKALAKLEAAAIQATGSGGGASGNGSSMLPPLESLVAAAAAAILELYTALNVEKGYGLFAGRGAWETRARELANGGNNPTCLQVLWSEMADGVRAWLSGAGGQAPNGAGGPPNAAGPGNGELTQAQHHAAYRAFGALGAAAERGEAYVNQVPLDRIMGSSREGYGALRDIVDRERSFIASRIESIGRGEPLSDEDFAALGFGRPTGPTSFTTPFGDYARCGSWRGGAGSAPLSWGLRSEMQQMRMIESEVDTDLDDGPEATDIEGSDDEAAPEPAAAAPAAGAPEAADAAVAAARPPVGGGPPEASVDGRKAEEGGGPAAAGEAAAQRAAGTPPQPPQLQVPSDCSAGVHVGATLALLGKGGAGAAARDAAAAAGATGVAGGGDAATGDVPSEGGGGGGVVVDQVDSSKAAAGAVAAASPGLRQDDADMVDVTA